MTRSLTYLTLASLLVSGASTPTGATAQSLQNPGFEVLGPDGDGHPGWSPLGRPELYTFAPDSIAASGRWSLRVEPGSEGATGFGGYVQSVSADPYRGHGIVLRGSIRTEEVESRSALWLRVDGPGGGSLTFDNMSGRSPTGTTEWTEYEIRLEVPPSAGSIVVGVLHSGPGTSWFDDLSVEVDSSVVAAEVEEPELPEPDATLPDENPEWVEHAAATGFPIASLSSESFDDLQFLKEVIGDRRVVQLGESGHGVAEFNAVKVRLIKFLHQEMGFDVIAFESSLQECWQANRRAGEFTAEELMESCIFAVWHTDETLELFEYVLETRATDRPLILAGFDTQTSSALAADRPGFWREVLSPVDEAYAEEVAVQDSQFLGLRRDQAAVAERRDELLAEYRRLVDYIVEREAQIARAHPENPEIAGVARRLAASTVHFIDQMSNTSGRDRTEARDSGMADNLDFLLDELYPGRKVITWGHNFHLRHANEAVSPSPVKTMGQWTAERRRDELYTVGLYMRWGRAALNNREVYNVEPPAAGSLESILGHVGEPYLFVDLARTSEGPGGAWVRQPITAKSWGRSDVTMVLADQYDAILFIDEVSPPSYR